MWLDGPHGVLSSDREQGMGCVMIAGVIGITHLNAKMAYFLPAPQLFPHSLQGSLATQIPVGYNLARR
jgi:predicted ferric reductase